MAGFQFWKKKNHQDDAPEVVEVAVEAVELPKRSLAKGVRSLFARIKFNPENLDELEDILIQGDFGVDASLEIVTEVKQRAKLAGAQTEQELKDILVAVLVDQLERSDKDLKLDGKKFPYVFLVVGVNGVQTDVAQQGVDFPAVGFDFDIVPHRYSEV